MGPGDYDVIIFFGIVAIGLGLGIQIAIRFRRLAKRSPAVSFLVTAMIIGGSITAAVLAAGGLVEYREIERVRSCEDRNGRLLAILVRYTHSEDAEVYTSSRFGATIISGEGANGSVSVLTKPYPALSEFANAMGRGPTEYEMEKSPTHETTLTYFGADCQDAKAGRETGKGPRRRLFTATFTQETSESAPTLSSLHVDTETIGRQAWNWKCKPGCTPITSVSQVPQTRH